MSHFQPRSMSWSYRSRGSDARSQTVPNSSAISFRKNQKTGMIQTFTVPCAGRKPSAGPDGPPRNSVTAIADIVMTFMNSARKKIANRIPVYSVWNPPTSSCSASTRSNGGWLVSATAAITKITNETIADAPVPVGHERVPARPGLRVGDAAVLSVPAWSSTATTDRPNAASYDSSWADARTEPSSGYFEPLDQPASITP